MRFKFQNIFSDSMLRNSLYQMLALSSNVIIGFAFWVIAARLCTTEAIGIAAALISVMSLPIALSRLGFDQSLVKFLPIGNRSKIVFTTATVTTFIAIILGVIAIITIDIWTVGLGIIKEHSIIFIIVLIATSILSMFGVAFLALRQSKYFLIQSLLSNAKILFISIFAFLGAIGIFISVGVANIIALIFSFIFLIRMGVKPKWIDLSFIKKSFKFSFANYLTIIFMTIPLLILPILILNTLGAEETGLFFIAYSISSSLFVVPTALSTSLFVEGSHGESMRQNAIKSVRVTFLILVPAILVLFFFGSYLLGFFGQDYVRSLDLLRILILSSFFVSIFAIFVSIKKVHDEMGIIIILSGFIFTGLIILSYLLMPEFGIMGVGYAWFIVYLIVMIPIGVIVFREKWLQHGGDNHLS